MSSLPLALDAIGAVIVACAVSAAMVPASMWLAPKLGVVDHPDADRHTHSRPTPRLGGIALFAGFAVAVALFGGESAQRWSVVAITGAICLAMVIDDALSMPWWLKLSIETCVAAAVGLTGTLITFLALPGAGSTLLVHLGWAALPVTMIWIVGTQNSINLIDGVDGVAAGVVAIAGLVLLVAAVERLSVDPGVQSGVIVLSAALVGCCLGFLFFNFSPARVFMGDSGSHFLGVAIGMVTILGVAKVAVALALIVPVLALGLPIGDTAFAIWRRGRSGQGIAVADRGHIHHRLLDRGLSARETALFFYLITAALGCLGLTLLGHALLLLVLAALLFAGVGVLVVRTRGRIQVGPPGKPPMEAVPPGRSSLG